MRIWAFVLAVATLVAAGAARADYDCGDWVAIAAKAKEATVAQQQATQETRSPQS
ncbi:MAG: hypothetical protein N2038_15390 [Geminicoccaceae bacterium]|nr:hypothetical protein [Geminicoccaceae bacterium]MCS7269237.1 hypothetical protein [Geminicoccaceae bacterium]MCX7631608.1 hypothetical protein [Geminicoccaceae bacterium]MDW8125913.1 hypothetical protein [Geminicoccaceae bacterium]MDW8342739.1 hypothetical protein [Geminicoccaceae bacterium]